MSWVQDFFSPFSSPSFLAGLPKLFHPMVAAAAVVPSARDFRHLDEYTFEILMVTCSDEQSKIYRRLYADICTPSLLRNFSWVILTSPASARRRTSPNTNTSYDLAVYKWCTVKSVLTVIGHLVQLYHWLCGGVQISSMPRSKSFYSFINRPSPVNINWLRRLQVILVFSNRIFTLLHRLVSRLTPSESVIACIKQE